MKGQCPIVYELNMSTASGGRRLFATIEAAQARASRVLEEWREDDKNAADEERHELVPRLEWNMEGDPRQRWTSKVLTAWYSANRDSQDGWAFTITEREVLDA